MIEESAITQLLGEANEGDDDALDRVVRTLYDDLRNRARSHMRKHFGAAAGAITLQPTALVNETYLRLLGQRGPYANTDHFLAIATRVMLRVLIDYERSRTAKKRGGGQIAVTLSGLAGDLDGTDRSASEIEIALERLDAIDARKGQIVKLRAIWGFEMEEIAAALDVSLSTVEREWRFAKAWLAEELSQRSS